MKNFNNSYIGLRQDILKFVEGEDNIILDVGCATGTNGEFLLKNKKASKVFGIEYSKEMAEAANKRNSKIFVGDLNDRNFREKVILKSPFYDYIFFADILEHLIDPESVILDLKKRLKPTGKIIISLPNIAHIETFIQVFIKGTWPKNPRGIFDSTHIRWFTKKDALAMVENCGLEVLQCNRKFRARDAMGSQFDWKYNILKIVNKDWVTFQYILYCGFEK